MRSLRQALCVAAYDFRSWRGNPRIFVTFSMAFILCFLLSDKVVTFAETYGTSLQIFEPFIWTFSDSTSVLSASLLLVFLFADMPFITNGTPFYLMRTTRRAWLLGQGIYIIAGTFVYMIFVLTATSLVCAVNAFSGNMWSSTAAMLGYSRAGSAIAVAATIKEMEMSTPYSCAAVIFLLMIGYALVMMSVMLLFNLLKGQRAGVISVFAFSLYGILLDPDLFATVLGLSNEEYFRANVLVGWLSPLNQATFPRHNFGYDLLPQLSQTYMIFTALAAALFVISMRIIRNYNFSFTGTQVGK